MNNLKQRLELEKIKKKEREIRKIFKHANLKDFNVDDFSKNVNNIPYLQYALNLEMYNDMLFKIKYVNKDLSNLVFTVDKDYEVEILTINLNGQLRWSKIVEVSVHLNLDGYSIQLKDEYANNLKMKQTNFKVSSDHSLLVYDVSKQKIIKATPKKISRNLDNYYFIGYPKKLFNNYIEIEQYKDLAFIPCSWFEFKPEQKLTLYDISVDDSNYCYFHISPGIFVVDTAIVYTLHTEEAKKEALEKMSLSKNLISSENINNFTYGIDKNALFGLIVGSQTSQDLGYKYSPKEFKFNVNSIQELRELLATELAGKYTIFDYIYVDNKKLTIGQAFIALTIKEQLAKR
jgi:hypothetical protein